MIRLLDPFNGYAVFFLKDAVLSPIVEKRVSDSARINGIVDSSRISMSCVVNIDNDIVLILDRKKINLEKFIDASVFSENCLTAYQLDGVSEEICISDVRAEFANRVDFGAFEMDDKENLLEWISGYIRDQFGLRSWIKNQWIKVENENEI